jgi:hypothetical protein
MQKCAAVLVRIWTRIYTSGMPPALANARRAEIESDLWEGAQLDDRILAAFVVLARLLRGVPDDLLWRAELMDLRSKRGRAGLWATTATIVLITGMWVHQLLQAPQLPDLPTSPMMIRVWLTRPMPPPPPPPPPRDRPAAPSADDRAPLRYSAPATPPGRK